MKKHSHNISQVNVDGDFQLSGTLKNYKITDTDPDTNTNTYTSYHHGSPDKVNRSIPVTVEFQMKDMKVSGGSSSFNTAVEAENYPSYTSVPVLMYIGVPRS